MIKKNAADLQHTFFQILVAMLMVFVLLICASSPSHAVVGVTSILIPSVIAALESWGISTAADGLDGAAIAEWFHDKLTDWSTYAGIALENIVTGIKMTPLGQVLLNPFALAGIREFGAWLVEQEGLVAGGSPVLVMDSGTFLNGYAVWQSVTFLFSNGKRDVYLASSNGYFIVNANVSSGSYILRPFSLVSGSKLTRTSYDASGNDTGSATLSMNSWNGSYYYYSSQTKYSVASVSVPVVTYGPGDVAAGSGGLVTSDGELSLVPSADMDVPTASAVQDKELLINTTLDVGADAAAWYEGVMQKVAANDFTATAAITQAGTITADQVIPQEGITDVDGTVSWPDVTAPIGVTGLDEIFPFCIPFDVYHFFQALAADPVAPSFEIPFVIPNIVDYTFELDLSDFDQVAQILRTVELLAFCVGLAFVTRSFFIRG